MTVLIIVGPNTVCVNATKKCYFSCKQFCICTFIICSFSLLLHQYYQFKYRKILSQSGLLHGEGYLGDEDLITEEAMYRIKLMQNLE